MVLHLVGRDFNSTALITSHRKNECLKWTYTDFHTILSTSWSQEAFSVTVSHQNFTYYFFMCAHAKPISIRLSLQKTILDSTSKFHI
jgi:hypothetical protein